MASVRTVCQLVSGAVASRSEGSDARETDEGESDLRHVTVGHSSLAYWAQTETAHAELESTLPVRRSPHMIRLGSYEMAEH